MPRSRPEVRLRSATRGGSRAGRDGPVLLQAGRHHWLLLACVPGWKNLANRAENVSLLGVCATSAWAGAAIALYPVPFGRCHMASEDDDKASISSSVRPFGWLWRHDGSAGALAKTGGLTCATNTGKSDAAKACRSPSVKAIGWLFRQVWLAPALRGTG